MTDRLTFRVFGDPVPQGSKRHVGHGVMVESGGARLTTWREDVKQAALAALAQSDFVLRDDKPLEVTLIFSLRRPQSHFSTSKARPRALLPNAPSLHTKRPDVDKIMRSTLDALTAAGAIPDDSVIAYVAATKTWCDVAEQPGAYISIVDLEHEGRRAI